MVNYVLAGFGSPHVSGILQVSFFSFLLVLMYEQLHDHDWGCSQSFFLIVLDIVFLACIDS